MKKTRKVFLILLLIAVLLGGAGILAGFLMGAKPLLIGNDILRQTVEKSNPDVYAGIQNMLSVIPSLS